MNRVMMVTIPLLTMFLVSTMAFGYKLKSQTVNIEGQSYVEGLAVANVLGLTVLIGTVLGICIAMAFKFFDTGISGSVIPIVFLVTILTTVYGFLSANSLPLFSMIPYGFGLLIFGGLTVMFVIGLASLSISSGGD
ncbi:MAG: hypothetical protein ACKD6O_08180 [Candidatus Bathyarchaeota archaeon]